MLVESPTTLSTFQVCPVAHPHVTARVVALVGRRERHHRRSDGPSIPTPQLGHRLSQVILAVVLSRYRDGQEPVIEPWQLVNRIEG